MRKILFRGKNVHNEWVEGYFYKAKFCRDDKELSCFITTPHPDVYNKPSDHIYIPDDSTIGQYTGLTDKNGTKIFEGDIVCFDGNLYKEIFSIVFVGGCFRLGTKNGYSYTLPNLCSALEVIGNIHDNPELLKGGGQE